MNDDSSVRVAVRIRPQSAREVIDMCRVCTSVTPGEPQVVLGENKAFTYDYVFGVDSHQQQLYNVCVRHLIEGCLSGYNATVLAYGQTGSGKTYTMGTGFETEVDVSRDERVGILPRAVHHLFAGMDQLRRDSMDSNKVPPEFAVHAQFLELYNEELIDLLEPTPRGQKSGMRIHEDGAGGIYIAGVTSRSVATADEALKCLRLGALARTTASTQMNAQSSRSHAIFTLHIRQQRLAPTQKNEENGYDTDMNMGSELETLTAKLHFVDLAGSERLKRTGATGDRAKEGISINCGLLALGNVISALGDISRKAQHVPYRDSKLTRLLQDSLGGNSRTLMIACISPSDRDFMETLSTLKYAHRARNIKNRVVLNQDRSSKTIALLRQEIINLQQELAEYKQGKRVVGEDGHEELNDMFHENRLVQAENQTLRTRVKALQETVDNLTLRNSELVAQKATAAWLNSDSEADVTKLVQNYVMEIEELRARLFESENTCAQLRKSAAKSPGRPSVSLLSPNGSSNVSELIEEAKRNLQKDLTMLQKNQLETGRKISGNSEGASSSAEGSRDPSSNSGSEDEEDEDDEEEDEGEAGETKESVRYSLELAELTSEISVKQKLIEELENSQRRLDVMKQHYEDKLTQLQERIRATQEERDKILANYSRGGGGASSGLDEKAKRIKDEYEKKISDLNNELKRLQAAQREHAKLLKSQSEAERQLKTMKNDLAEMKKVKVKLMQKMKEEAARHKGLELKHSKELAQLRKDSRKRENEIRTLQAEKQLKESVLKRKQEEVMALRKLTRSTMSDQAAGRVSAKRRNAGNTGPTFSPKVAKQKWQSLETNLSRIANNKIAVSQLEKELERMIAERDNVGRSLSAALRQRDRAQASGKEESYVREIEEQIEAYQANFSYIQENMAECQRNIVLIEETKEGCGDFEVDSLAQVASLEEARYLVTKLVGMTLDQAVLIAQKEVNLRDLQSQLKQVSELDAVHQQLLQHVLANSDMELYNLLANAGVSHGYADHLAVSSQSSRSASPVESIATVATHRSSSSNKARRRTFAAPEELLYSISSSDAPAAAPPAAAAISEEKEEHLSNSPKRGVKSESSDPRSLELPLLLQPQQPTLVRGPGTGASSSSASLTSLNAPPLSPRLPRKAANASASNLLAKANNLDIGDFSSSAPASPPTFRRSVSREENPNVFSRLTSGTNVGCEPVPDEGVINPYHGKSSNRSPLICTHVAEGHCQAVLSLCATDTLLFSASKDRTVKVWDLTTGAEQQSLGRHPNSVAAVKHCPESNLVFTASSFYVKVWDLRQSPANCVKTLHASGYSSSGSFNAGRSLQLPAGESLMNDIAPSTINSNLLYAAAGNQVRIWDLRKMSSTGKLSGGHQAAVMRLQAGPIVSGDSHRGEYVATGSKDHYVKVFEVRDSAATGVLTPKFNLDPPHYDGVQCLDMYGSTLVSGSRDACIKVWDLQLGEQVLSFSNAHRDWICGLAHLPDVRIIFSGCRGGFVRLWSTESWESLGEIRAHNSPINAIAANSSNIFTASSDNTINIWRLRSNVDISPEPSDQF